MSTEILAQNTSNLPKSYEHAKNALAICERIDECRDWADKSMALAAYAKQAGDETLLNHARRIQCRAMRRMGKVIALIEPGKPGPKSELSTTNVTQLNKTETARAAGISKRQQDTAFKVADIPENDFEKLVEAEKAPTISGLIREIKRKELTEKLDALGKTPVGPLQGAFDVIVIDPPWPMVKIEREVRPNQVVIDYPTMSIAEIKEIEIPCADDCHIWLWTTHKYLPDAIELIRHWGFKYVCTFVWKKPGGPQPFNLPQYNCEFAIYARKGTPLFFDTKSFNTCFDAPRGKHSEKPTLFYDTVRRTTKGRKLDMFNRREITGFEGWGNESLEK
jgi:N6-adenosine-specific RNA methylase IME4